MSAIAYTLHAHHDHTYRHTHRLASIVLLAMAVLNVSALPPNLIVYALASSLITFTTGFVLWSTKDVGAGDVKQAVFLPLIFTQPLGFTGAKQVSTLTDSYQLLLLTVLVGLAVAFVLYRDSGRNTPALVGYTLGVWAWVFITLAL